VKKVVIESAGGYEKLRIRRGADPSPGSGEVVLETRAIGVNFADSVVRMGLYESAKEYVGWPITPGFECAGRVLAVGPEVDPSLVGAERVALTRFGAYATHVAVPVNRTFPIPDELGVAQASSFYVAHLTAWYALRDLCRPRPGNKVLVHSAAGGVGSALVLVAKALGCSVAGVVGATHKVASVHALGADLVIDKSQESLWPAARRFAPKGYHVVLDANGVETLKGSYAHLAPMGRLVVYGFHTMFRKGGSGRPELLKLAADYARTPRFNPIAMTNANKSVLAFNLSYLLEEAELLKEAMAEIGTWLREKKLGPVTLTEYPLERVAEAHRALDSGETVGKLVLIP
jgi:NADPH:quinone reductase-like Zn-dependent oxidoreductase